MIGGVSEPLVGGLRSSIRDVQPRVAFGAVRRATAAPPWREPTMTDSAADSPAVLAALSRRSG
jgi:hypothetical protein